MYDVPFSKSRHLFREEEVEAAVRYTLDEQGESMAWYAKS